MPILNVNPTRMELSRMKDRLSVAQKGHRLLRDKRDEMMRRFLLLVREARQLRGQVEADIAAAMQQMELASSRMQPQRLDSALLLSTKSARLTVSSQNIMGVNVPIYAAEYAGEGASALSYGYAFTTEALDEAVTSLSDLLPHMLRLAELEKSVQMLSAEIEKTRRRVNALEHVMIPNYVDTVKHITMRLDENERGNLTRLMKVKDMMVEKEYEGRESRD
ncbi:MAG: V-type ATP synthase subunit D [Oscillospiraceae bacterium]|nr:V-type ATP synthase subunit D [Oscillospiraceae bacterium]